MAQGLLLSSGSPLIGSPIVYQVQAAVIAGECAFHRVKLTVTAVLEGDPVSRQSVSVLSSPAESGETLKFDISSCLRAVAENFEHSYTPPQNGYPRICYKLSACDEYMQNGETHDNVGVVNSPADGVTPAWYYNIMGAFSDLERLLSPSAGRSVQRLSRKPSSALEVVAIGESVVVPQSYATAQTCEVVSAGPTVQVADVTQGMSGVQTLAGRQFYVIPAASDRYEFRFVNGFGVLESISVHSLRRSEMNVTTEENIRAIQEQFASMSRASVHKSNDYEVWKLSSGPLNPDWQSWFMHEFLMCSQAWIHVGTAWIPCHILPDETVTGLNRVDNDICETLFSVRLDINGSPLQSLTV